MLQELARFNSSFLLPVPVHAGAGEGQVAEASYDDRDAVLMVSEGGNLTRVGQAPGFVDEARAVSALLPLMAPAASPVRQCSAYIRSLSRAFCGVLH
jgi:hypothetical protein